MDRNAKNYAENRTGVFLLTSQVLAIKQLHHKLKKVIKVKYKRF